MAKAKAKAAGPKKLWVRFKQCRVGQVDGVSFVDQVGDEKEIGEAEALRCQAAGQLQIIPAPSAKESAVAR